MSKRKIHENNTELIEVKWHHNRKIEKDNYFCGNKSQGGIVPKTIVIHTRNLHP